jgi:hypothetical protein
MFRDMELKLLTFSMITTIYTKPSEKKKDTAEKQQAKRDAQKEERARQRAIRAAQPKPSKPPRPSRAKNWPITLASSILPNTPFQPHMHNTPIGASTSSTITTLESENIPLQTTPLTRHSAPIPPTLFYESLTPTATQTHQETSYSSNIQNYYRQSNSSAPLTNYPSYSYPSSSTNQSPYNVERRSSS